MRSTLIIDLIEAYHQGKEPFFVVAERIADEEARKGNDKVAKEIRNALYVKSSKGATSKEVHSSSLMFKPSSTLLPWKQIPKDKDNAADLFEIIEPSLNLNDLIYPEQIDACFKQIIHEWENAARLLEMGLMPSRRILFYGPPGCGKTSAGLALAKAIGLPVAYVRLDSVFSSFLGQTSTNLRRIFDAVKSGSIALFLDEFDAIAKKRDDSQEVGELKRVVISLLQNLDSLPDNVLLIAATNHEHLLDPAIWRRFDVTVSIDPPSDEQRKVLLTTFLSKYKLDSDFSYDRASCITKNLNCSRIKDLVQQTIKKSLFIEHKTSISIKDFVKTFIERQISYSSLDVKGNHEALLSLKQAGFTFREIANLTGIPRSTLSDHLKQA